jgi:hypothetical protein
MVGIRVMFGVVVSPFWCQHPSNNEISLEMRGNGATIIAYPSSCSCVEQLLYW